MGEVNVKTIVNKMSVILLGLAFGFVIAFLVVIAVYGLLRLFIPTISSGLAIIIGIIVALLLIVPEWDWSKPM